MIYEFEGKTEKDAIDNAVAQLNLTVDQFDVEILEIQKGGLFKKGNVKIRVHVDDAPADIKAPASGAPAQVSAEQSINVEPATPEAVNTVVDFLHGILTRMGYEAEISVLKNDGQDILCKIAGSDAPYIIGKKGKTLDALQLFANIYISKLGFPHARVTVDCENYRLHKEESIVKLAYETADRVATTKRSILLEPMNPYERRLVHTALSDISYIETKSEGDGLYKQVRVLYKK